MPSQLKTWSPKDQGRDNRKQKFVNVKEA